MNNMVNKCCDSNCYLGQATDLINHKLLILNVNNGHGHGLRTPREEMAFHWVFVVRVNGHEGLT